MPPQRLQRQTCACSSGVTVGVKPPFGRGFRTHDVVEAPGIEPGSEAAFHATSTSVVPVFISPEPRPGTRLGFGQPRCTSRPAPRRHRAARLLALTSGPSPTAEKTVDVRPKPELFSSLLLTQRGREVRYSHVYFSRFYEPGARLAFARPTTPSKPIRPHGRSNPRSPCASMIPRDSIRCNRGGG